jgi:selenide,water dikinase
LLGHGLEMCRGSGLAARISFAALPLLEGVAELARVPYRTGAAVRNWDSYGQDVALAPGLADWQRDVLADPQTSGGLLISLAPDGVEAALAQLQAAGFESAAVIGVMEEGVPRIYAGL